MTKKMTKAMNHKGEEWIFRHNGVGFSPLTIAEGGRIVRCKQCEYWWKENELCMHPEHCGGDSMVSLCYMTCRADDYCSKGENK